MKSKIFSSKAGGSKRKRPVISFSDTFLQYFPYLKREMVLADMAIGPVQFMDKVLKSTLITSAVLLILGFLIFGIFNIDWFFIIPMFLVVVPMSFFYFLSYPSILALKRKREIEYEIVFAGRHLFIALKSGMPLFDAMVGVSKGYGSISKEFNRIVEKITVGVPMTQAIREVIMNSPSPAFKRIAMQIANSISSGSDVANALNIVLDQIFKEQVIELKTYGQRLNPMIMFYMIFGIIFPSIGVAFAIILLSLLGGGNVSSSFLGFVFIFIGVVQFLFLAMIESSRPKFAL
ncbi:type II secretion system F family protein [Candidatus Micrarchaeota archaeon]|nr:type II secretion system F family protein [Candidatus Micrarchaeota archaeon]